LIKDQSFFQNQLADTGRFSHSGVEYKQDSCPFDEITLFNFQQNIIHKLTKMYYF